MQTISLHGRATAAVAPTISRVRPVDLGLPTPCAGWDLRALLEHMVGQDHGFAAAVRAGSDVDVDVAEFAPRPLGADPAATAAVAAADADAAFTEAAGDPGRTVWLPEFGHRFPLDRVAGFHLLDTLVHGWDVGAALGLAVDVDEDLAAACHEQAQGIPDGPFREEPGSPFAPAVAAAGGTDPWERTLALLGRDPMWTPYRAAGGTRPAP